VLHPRWVCLWREPLSWACSVVNRKIRFGKLAVDDVDAIDASVRSFIGDRIRVLRALHELGRPLQHWHILAYTQPAELARLLDGVELRLNVDNVQAGSINVGAELSKMVALPDKTKRYIEQIYAEEPLLRDGYNEACRTHTADR
jgi:hypothetical protein